MFGIGFTEIVVNVLVIVLLSSSLSGSVGGGVRDAAKETGTSRGRPNRAPDPRRTIRWRRARPRRVRADAPGHRGGLNSASYPEDCFYGKTQSPSTSKRVRPRE